MSFHEYRLSPSFSSLLRTSMVDFGIVFSKNHGGKNSPSRSLDPPLSPYMNILYISPRLLQKNRTIKCILRCLADCYLEFGEWQAYLQHVYNMAIFYVVFLMLKIPISAGKAVRGRLSDRTVNLVFDLILRLFAIL